MTIICLQQCKPIQTKVNCTPQSKSCKIRAGTTRTVDAFSCTVQKVEWTQHDLCYKCSLAK